MKREGILCPICDCKMHMVTETRKEQTTLKRTRECFNGHKFITGEFVLGVPKVKKASKHE